MWGAGPKRTFGGMKPRIVRLCRRLLAVTAVFLLVSGTGHALANPGDDRNGVATVVRDLTNGDLAAEDLPDDFSRVMGYSPVLEGDRLLKPHAECSFPIRIHPEAFEVACHAHDFGYDLLRYGELTGHSPGMSLRFEIDRRFHRDLIDACDDIGCRLLAHLFSSGVALNSIRQGYTSPTLEPPMPWLLIGTGGLAVSLYRRNRSEA